MIDFFGMQYTVPQVENLRGTVVAVNVGGAVIPTIMSVYLLVTRQLWVPGAIAAAIVAMVLHWLATPVAGIGIAVPVFFRQSSRRWSPCCCRAAMPRRSHILAAAWAR